MRENTEGVLLWFRIKMLLLDSCPYGGKSARFLANTEG